MPIRLLYSFFKFFTWFAKASKALLFWNKIDSFNFGNIETEVEFFFWKVFCKESRILLSVNLNLFPAIFDLETVLYNDCSIGSVKKVFLVVCLVDWIWGNKIESLGYLFELLMFGGPDREFSLEPSLLIEWNLNPDVSTTAFEKPPNPSVTIKEN